MSPLEYYERYMSGHIFRDDEDEKEKYWAVLENKGPDKDPDPGFYPDNEKEESFETLHPLRKQYLENHLKDLDYQERQQMMQDSFTTAMYGKKDYSEERNNILKELEQGKQSRMHGYKYPDEKFWDIADRQMARNKYPKTPEAVGKEISRFEREYPDSYQKYIQEIENAKRQQIIDDKKSWQEINKDINTGKITPQDLSGQQWQTILNKSAEELQQAGEKSEVRCNFYVRDQLLKQGIYMPPNQNANQIKDYMDNNSQIWEKMPKATDEKGNPTEHLDHQAAYDAAKNGDTVVVVYKNPNPSPEEHGHIARVDGQKEMQTSGKKFWDTDVPQIDGYHSDGTDKGIKIESLSKQFSPKREPYMDYYRYIGPKRKQTKE